MQHGMREADCWGPTNAFVINPGIRRPFQHCVLKSAILIHSLTLFRPDMLQVAAVHQGLDLAYGNSAIQKFCQQP